MKRLVFLMQVVYVNIFKENVLEPRAYFIPFASKQELDKTDIRTERYNSSMVTSLSGEWNFKYYSKHSEIPESFDTQKEKTDIIFGKLMNLKQKIK